MKKLITLALIGLASTSAFAYDAKQYEREAKAIAGCAYLCEGNLRELAIAEVTDWFTIFPESNLTKTHNRVHRDVMHYSGTPTKQSAAYTQKLWDDSGLPVKVSVESLTKNRRAGLEQLRERYVPVAAKALEKRISHGTWVNEKIEAFTAHYEAKGLDEQSLDIGFIFNCKDYCTDESMKKSSRVLWGKVSDLRREGYDITGDYFHNSIDFIEQYTFLGKTFFNSVFKHEGWNHIGGADDLVAMTQEKMKNETLPELSVGAQIVLIKEARYWHEFGVRFNQSTMDGYLFSVLEDQTREELSREAMKKFRKGIYTTEDYVEGASKAIGIWKEDKVNEWICANLKPEYNQRTFDNYCYDYK